MDKMGGSFGPRSTKETPFSGKWAIGGGLVVFLITFLGGYFFLFPSDGSLMWEAECRVILPNLPSEWVENIAIRGAKCSSLPSETIRSFLAQHHLQIPPKVEVDISTYGRPTRAGDREDICPSQKWGILRFTYRSSDSFKAMEIVEDIGFQVVKKWEVQYPTQGDSAEKTSQCQQLLHQLEGDWISLGLEGEIYSNYFDQFAKLLEEFLNPSHPSSFPAKSSSPRGSSVPPAEGSPSRPENSSRPSPGLKKIAEENPQWTALSQKLHQLQTRLEELLESRTPLHPEVQQTQAWIAETKALLAKTPRSLNPSSLSSPLEGDQAHPPLGLSFLSGSRAEKEAIASEQSLLTGKASPGAVAPVERNIKNHKEPQVDSLVPGRETAPVPLASLEKSLAAFGAFWEVFEVRLSRLRQRAQQRLRQAQHLLSQQHATQDQASKPIRLESRLQPLKGGPSVDSKTWLWKLAGMSLVVGGLAAGLAWIIRRPAPAIVQPQIFPSFQPLPIQGAERPEMTSPAGSAPQIPTDPARSVSPSSQTDGRLYSVSAMGRCEPVFSEPAGSPLANPSSQLAPEAEQEILEECIRSLQELQAGFSFPVIGMVSEPSSQEKAPL